MISYRRFCLLAVLFLSGLPLFAAAAAYRSNDFGMQLEPIPSWRRDETTWILEVAPTATGEVRRLLHDGKEVRRWEITSTAGSHRVERELAAGALVARREYSANGDLLEEDQYSKGNLTEKSLYTYVASRVARVRVLGADGSVIHTEDFLYTSRGDLREVRRTGSKEGVQVASFISGRSGLSEEREQVGDEVSIARYDARGRTEERESRRGKELVSREDFVYRGDTDKLLSAVEKRPGEGRVIARAYDAEGRLQTETVSAGSKVVEEVGYTRDDKGRVTRKLRRSAAGLEEWRYTLDEKGKTTREEFFRRGSLEKVTQHGANDSRTEELYQGGALFLKVYFEGDRRVREEVFADGKLVRTRTFD